MAKIKILKRDLICSVCSSDEWHKTRIKFIGSTCLKDKFVEQERTILECVKCGHGMWFGVVYDWDNDTYNMEITPTEYDKQFDL